MKKIMIFGFTFILFILSLSNYSYACVPAPTTIIVECSIKDKLFQQNVSCLNDYCSVNVSKDKYGELSINLPNSVEMIYPSEYFQYHSIVLSKSYERQKLNDLEYLISVIDKICVENIDDIKLILNQKIEKWIEIGGYTLLEPYSKDTETELIKSKNNFLECYYEDFERIGNWITVNHTYRDYCYYYPGTSDCPEKTISYSQFLIFLMNNPNIATLPYLFGYLLIIALFVVFLIGLSKTKELKQSFKPNKFNIIFTSVLSVPTILFFILILQAGNTEFIGIEKTIVWIIVYYIFGSSLKYIYSRIKNK